MSVIIMPDTVYRPHANSRNKASLSPLSLTAIGLTLCGLTIGVLDIRWSLQLVSLGCVYSGALLATIGLLVHLRRGNTAWAADASLLLGLAVLLYSGPVLPVMVQDYLEYFMP